LAAGCTIILASLLFESFEDRILDLFVPDQPRLHWLLQENETRKQKVDSSQQTARSRQQTKDSRRWITHLTNYSTADIRQQPAESNQLTTDSSQQKEDSRQQPTDLTLSVWPGQPRCNLIVSMAMTLVMVVIVVMMMAMLAEGYR
jgi:hypothetical protein